MGFVCPLHDCLSRMDQGEPLCFLEEGEVFLLVCWKLFRTWRISGKPFPRAAGLRMLHTGDVVPGGGVQPCGAFLRKSETWSVANVMLTILHWARLNEGS